MIIDADTHISPTGEDAMAITYDELLRRMDRAGVDKALTWLRPPYMREIAESNAYVYEAMWQHPDRILGFGWADPRLGLDKAKEAVRHCIYEYGFYGVKLNGAQNSFYIDHPDVSLPVVEEIARMFPEVHILMVHMGGVAYHDLSSAAIEMAQECPNLTLIGSAVRAQAILKAIKTLGACRVCFGSDTPFELMHVEVAKYHALLDGEVTPEEKQMIMAGNIARLMGLDITWD
jgi:hypothetical protein